MSAAISDASDPKSCLPGFLDVDSTECGFAGEYERFERMAKLVESLEFGDDGFGHDSSFGDDGFVVVDPNGYIVQ